VSTTAALLAQAETADRLAVAAIDTHLGDWFCAIREGNEAPFLAATETLSQRLEGRPCHVVGPQADVLASRLADAVAQLALPDAAVVARLALADGVEHWRKRNCRDGLPRPLYLRGVNITLPDGARRTVE
jgi:tRNA threonylcarbamoyladenosine biosynthesis protein TsaB